MRSRDGTQWVEVYDDELDAAVLVRDLGTAASEAPERFFDGPFTAGPPTGPAAPPEALVDDVPLLPTAVLGPTALPAVRDWSWRAGEQKSRFSIVADVGEWGAVDDSMLSELLALHSAVDRAVRGSIETWAWRWPDAAAPMLRLQHPAFVQDLYDAATRHVEHPRGREAFRRRWVDTALTTGLHEHYRRLVAWPDPHAMACAVCGRVFAPETLSWWMAARYGPARYCPGCCCRAANPLGFAVDSDYVVAALQVASTWLGFIPSQNVAGHCDLGAIGETDRRDRIMAALVTLPSPDQCADALGIDKGRGRWLRVLQAVGLVDDAWRPGRGTFCLAADGHACRSLGERSVDDYLSRHGIAHEPEPDWPLHPELNPSSRLRADWRLADGTFVEYAGMIADADYLAKIDQKHRLAEALSIPLIVITPDDLSHLGDLIPATLPPESQRPVGF